MNAWKRLGLILGAEFALVLVGLAFISATMYQVPFNPLIGLAGLGFAVFAWFNYQALPYHQKAIAAALIIYPIGIFVILMLAAVMFYDDPTASSSDESFSTLVGLVMIGIFAFLLLKYPNWMFPVLQPETATELTGQLLKWFPNNVYLLRHRSHAYTRMNDHDAAKATLDQAVEQRPKDIKLLAQRVTNSAARNDYEAVLSDTERIAAINPNMPFNALYHASALADLRRYDEAFAAYEQAISEQKSPLEHAMLLAGCAELFRFTGDLTAAEHDLAQIDVDKIPKQQQIALQMIVETTYGYIMLLRDQLTEAETHFQTALGLVQHLPQALVGLAIIQYAQGKEDKAHQYWQTLVREHPKYADADWAYNESHLPEQYQEIISKIAGS